MKTPVAGRQTKIKSRFLPLLAALVAVAVGLMVFAVVRLVGPFRESPHATTLPAKPPQQPRPPGGTDLAVAADQAKPIYEGPLGDFIVGIHQGSSAPPCQRPFRPAKNEKIKASDLYSPLFGDNLEGFVVECADGKITAIGVFGPEVMGKGYFVGRPIVPYEAPAERLKLLTVASKPAIAQLPGFPGTLRLAVIERFPIGNQPGILVSIENTFKNLDAAAGLAAQIMGVRQ